MAKKKQLWLPKVREVERFMKNPQPRESKLKRPRKFELLHHPFDLRFKGRINKWLVDLEKKNIVEAGSIVEEKRLEAIRLYFYPQGDNGRWLNQEEVIEKTGYNTKKKLKSDLVEGLVKIWTAAKKTN